MVNNKVLNKMDNCCCSICLDLCDGHMFQCKNGHLVCAGCLKIRRDEKDDGAEPVCALCKQETYYCRSLVAEGMIGKMSTTCQYCGVETTRETLASHVKKCSSVPNMLCSRHYAGCTWTGKENKRDKHETNCPIVEICETVIDVLTDENCQLFVVHQSLLGFVELLLQNDKELIDKKEKVLCIGARRGDETLVKLLLQKGVNVNAGSLHRAISHGHVEVVKMLLDAGADVNVLEDHFSPLASAATKGQVAIVRILIEAGADVNACESSQGVEPGYTALHWTAGIFQEQTMKILISGGADVNKTDKKGRTPLHIATRESVYKDKDHKDKVTMSVKVLLEAGADVNKADKKGRTPLHYIANTADKASVFAGKYGDIYDYCRGGLEVLKLLFEAGADVNKVDKHGKIPLHIALRHVRTGVHASLVKAFLEAGADTNKANKKGKTPLDIHFQTTSNDIYQHYNAVRP